MEIQRENEKSENCNFSFAHYRECIELISTSGSDVEMIHDIDFAPDNLLDMASIEKKYGVAATYFVRLHAKTYNPFALPYIRMLRQLVDEYGHTIGLHFEPTFYDNESISAAILNESSALSSILGVGVSAVSIHEPARFGSIDPDMMPSGLQYYCWDSPYYRNKKYISDSSMRWREGCMCQNLHHPRLIILTHPDHWFHQTSAENY